MILPDFVAAGASMLHKHIMLLYREYEAAEHSAQEVKDEVEMHLKEKEILEQTIPSNIIIGPFWVSTESVRQNLSKKRRNLSNAVLELLARKLRTQADDVRLFRIWYTGDCFNITAIKFCELYSKVNFVGFSYGHGLIHSVLGSGFSANLLIWYLYVAEKAKIN